MGPEITQYQYCYREMVREDPSEFPGIHGKAPFRTSLNICYWDQPHQDCSHQHLPHHPQCECPACDHISWDNTKGGRNPLEIAAVRIAPWDQRIMKNAGPLFSSLEGNEPTVIWNATVANQALDKYENHYPAWQATQEWSISTAVSLSDSGLAMGGPDSRSGKLPAAMYEPFLPRNSATAYAEMAALVHAQVDTIVSAIPDRALPYARLNSQLHMLEWRYGSSAHPTATAPDQVINWGPPIKSTKRRMAFGRHRTSHDTRKQRNHQTKRCLLATDITVLGELTKTCHRCKLKAIRVHKTQVRTNPTNRPPQPHGARVHLPPQPHGGARAPPPLTNGATLQASPQHQLRPRTPKCRHLSAWGYLDKDSNSSTNMKISTQKQTKNSQHATASRKQPIKASAFSWSGQQLYQPQISSICSQT